ncbi:LuxR C-terminal-related transcriptional regulator [Hydrocarboniphaga sp.]|uniref:LuxR C-terminal-related transcriptional regulator n=1 Tax=Hydrocarboniphaga sp. TaxID=2033016 RepID=UPI003D124A42
MSEQYDVSRVRIATPADVRPAAENLRDIAAAMGGLRVAICHNIAVNQSMEDADGNVLATSVFGWTFEEDDRWWRSPRLALKSPLPTACRYESEPFWCNAEGFRTSLPNPMLDMLDRADFVRRGLTPAAIVVPVHLPFGQIGAASYVPADRNKLDLAQEFDAYAVQLGVLTRHFIAGYVRSMCNRERLPVGPVLSKREVECLRWASMGKTDDEISLIIARSRATVRFHMHSASTKLNSVTRSQTLFKATQLGYISFSGGSFNGGSARMVA